MTIDRYHTAVLGLLLLACTAAAVLGGSARAEFSFCNKTSYALSASLGFVEGDDLLTRGWWQLRPGACETVIKDAIAPGRYFVYAEAIPGHRGDLKTWSGETPLCVQNDALFNLRDQSICETDPIRQRNFRVADVTAEDEGNYTAEFVDTNNFTIYQAQVAGVQRLLSDVGFDIGAIDGYLGSSTKSALRQYRRSRGIGREGVVDDQVLDTLIAEANEQDAKLGFFFCNETRLPVWAAFAQPTEDREGYRASGWWLLESEGCAKVRRGALGSEPYYVYGVMQGETEERALAGGDTPFCVSTVQFEARSDVACEASDYETARFKRIDTGGEKAWTFVFRPEQFNPDLAQAAQ